MAGESEKIILWLRGAWQRRWWILGLQVLAAAATVAAFYGITPKYRSTTTVRFEPDSVLNPLTQGLAVATPMESVVGTMRQNLLSRGHIEEVIAHLGLDSRRLEPIEHEQLVFDMASAISVDVTTPPRRSTGASLFHISYLGEDPEETRQVVTALADLFIRKTQTTKSGESDAAFDFIGEQLETYRRKLEESENALRSFEEKHIDALPDSRNASITHLETLRSTLRDVHHRIDQARIQKNLLIERISAEASPADESGDVPNPLIATLKEKEDELQALKRRYADNYPDVISLRGEIDMLRRDVAARPTVPASEVRRTSSAVEDAVLDQLQQTDVEIESLTARVPKLEKEIATLERKVRGIPKSEQELVRLQRDYDVNSNIYEMFLRRLEEARVSRELELVKKGDVLKVVEEANLPLVPFTPKRRMFFLIGLAAGLALNAALLYWIFSRDSSFRGARDAEEYLGVTIIARIPRIDLGERKGTALAQAVSFSGALAAFAVLYVGVFYWDRVLNILNILKAGI